MGGAEAFSFRRRKAKRRAAVSLGSAPARPPANPRARGPLSAGVEGLLIPSTAYWEAPKHLRCAKKSCPE